ncbi:hypothetical protein CYY_008313 [Polysphondylium violaceum]|uniref:Transmembrane protein n=1 Tax=Polysphondylium violaceum TaxID=133409 RepID=A0A8J4PNK1_9MYCE|nr:hypothetical protein CYY_008313 [Polysphondylium violaceum]
MGAKAEVLLRILVILCGIALIGLTVPYWIYMKYAIDDNAYVGMAIYIVSAVILIILAILAFVGSIKKMRSLLLYFAIVMIVMLIFGIVQIIITNLDIANCDDSGVDDNFSFLCAISKPAYYVPMAILLFINLFGAVVSLILRYKLAHDTDGKYY